MVGRFPCGFWPRSNNMPSMGTATKGGQWSGWRRWLVGLAIFGAVSTVALYGIVRSKRAVGNSPSELSTPTSVPVQVCSPLSGGIDRVCLQPGSVEPFEAADLYAKVSGFLVEQKVDIGYPV